MMRPTELCCITELPRTLLIYTATYTLLGYAGMLIADAGGISLDAIAKLCLHPCIF
jgi:hypothetical protein